VPVEATQYPVNLILSGEACLVVGGGPVAARKIDGLLACHARVHVIAETVGPEVRARPVAWEERSYRRGDVADFRLVLAATDDTRVNHMIYEEARAAGVWVNTADDPAACTFTLPSIVRRGPIMVTVSTGGYSPALATWLRARVERELGPEYEILVSLLSEARNDMKAAGRSTEEGDWQSALDSDMLDLIRAGQVDQAKERLRACLSSSSD
jgi:precorrin-2 dehydrogenase / sirohydrochlorin ferrochelatase